MPILSSFYGIFIKMYFRQSEHNPPHIHAVYGEYIGVVDINTGKLLNGNLPTRALKLIQEWIQLHKIDLLDMWNTQEFRKIPPLK